MKRILLTLTAAVALAQSFEVASIRPSAQLKAGELSWSGFRPSGSNFTGSRVTLSDIVTYAYSVRPLQLSSLPQWAKSDRWDIAAKTPGDRIAGNDEIRAMLRQLLADRFRLNLKREMRDTNVYRLSVGSGGFKLRRPTDQALPASRRVARADGVQEWAEGRISMQTIFGIISVNADRPLVDMTGLQGEYVFKIQFAPAAFLTGPNAPAGPPIYNAVEDQLGLKLEAVQLPLEYLTVERIEKPSKN